MYVSVQVKTRKMFPTFKSFDKVTGKDNQIVYIQKSKEFRYNKMTRLYTGKYGFQLVA